MKSKKIKIIPLLRLIILLPLFCFYAKWHFSRGKLEPFFSNETQFYASQCDDQFSRMIQKEISKTTKSIFLSMYSLQDPSICSKLEKKALEGVKVSLILDAKTGSQNFSTIKPVLKTGASLMHQKILVLDGEKVLIGSANFTPDSLHVDDNFIASFTSKKLGEAIYNHEMVCFDQTTFWPLPEAKKEAYDSLCKHLDLAKKSIYVAMFTWTHPELTQKIIEAKKKGVKVTVFLDGKSAEGTSKKALKELQEANIVVYLSPTNKTLHHKMALIDDDILFFGSANWTKAAFSKNEECLLMIKSLNKNQKKKLKQLFHACQCEAHRP